jgi:hypothetical protein
MVSSVRHSIITNTTAPAALMPSGDPGVVIAQGQDYAFLSVKRTIITAEIGTGTGQTQDTTSNPTTGFLFAQFQGCSIKNVISASLIKNKTSTNVTVFEQFFDGYNVDATNTRPPSLSFRIVNPVYDDIAKPGYNQDYASLFLLDSGADAASKIANGDRVLVLLELGNS